MVLPNRRRAAHVSRAGGRDGAEGREGGEDSGELHRCGYIEGRDWVSEKKMEMEVGDVVVVERKRGATCARIEYWSEGAFEVKRVW